MPSSLTSTYKLFILPLHAVAIGFHVPTSAEYDCSAYLLVSQKGKEAHLQSASHAKGQSTTSVLSAFTCLNFDFLCLLLLCYQIKGKCELKITAKFCFLCECRSNKKKQKKVHYRHNPILSGSVFICIPPLLPITEHIFGLPQAIPSWKQLHRARINESRALPFTRKLSAEWTCSALHTSNVGSVSGNHSQ